MARDASRETGLLFWHGSRDMRSNVGLDRVWNRVPACTFQCVKYQAYPRSDRSEYNNNVAGCVRTRTMEKVKMQRTGARLDGIADIHDDHVKFGPSPVGHEGQRVLVMDLKPA